MYVLHRPTRLGRLGQGEPALPGHGLYALSQAGKPRIPEAAGRTWVESVFVNTLGRPATATESQFFTNSLRIGAMTFAEAETAIRKLPRAAGPGYAVPRATAPAPPGPPGPPGARPFGGFTMADIPSWAWWGGGGVLALLGLRMLMR